MLADNWAQLPVRFIVEDHGIRRLKDAMSRQILNEFNAAGIGIASGTHDIVGLPEVRVQMMGEPRRRRDCGPAGEDASSIGVYVGVIAQPGTTTHWYCGRLSLRPKTAQGA